MTNGGTAYRDRWTRDGVFPVGSPIRRAARAINAIPMAGRMVLMELAHPAVAAAVNDNDRFRRDPTRRAVVTAEAIGDIIHGSREDAERVSGRLAAVHARVNGPGYRASDPELVLWVAATYFDSVLLALDLWRQPVTPADQQQLFEQMTEVIALLGCPREQQPQSFLEFRRHVDATLAGLTVSPIAIDVARDIFWPSNKGRHRAPMALYRLISFGYVPEQLRHQFGYEWTPHHERALRSLVRAAPFLRPVSEAALHRLADGQGRPLRVLMSIAGYQGQPERAATPSRS